MECLALFSDILLALPKTGDTQIVLHRSLLVLGAPNRCSDDDSV